MAFQTPITIKEAIDNIHNNRYLLPAIQREFVWQPHQIERLFDSLMRGYPIGSFLFWRVDPETAKNYSFYHFITDYDQRKPHNTVHGAPATVPGMKAVLDGQQRLTALNIGLYGTGRWKLPRLWRDNSRAFPERKLHLNLLAPLMEDDEELSYKFRLLPAFSLKGNHLGTTMSNTGTPWETILDVRDPADLIDIGYNLGLMDRREPLKMLGNLKLHGVDNLLSFTATASSRPTKRRLLFLLYQNPLPHRTGSQHFRSCQQRRHHALLLGHAPQHGGGQLGQGRRAEGDPRSR